MMPVLQDLNQLKKLYPDMWETFIGMAGAIASFAPNDITTAEWLSKRSGEGERTFTTTSRNFGKSGGISSGVGPNSGSSNSGWNSGTTTNASQMKAPVLTAHKLYGLPPGFLTIALDGLSHLIPAYAPGYQDIRECWIRARDNPYYLR